MSDLSKENSIQDDDQTCIPSLEIPLITSGKIPIIKDNVLGENELIKNIDTETTINSFTAQKAGSIIPNYKNSYSIKDTVKAYKNKGSENFKTPDSKSTAAKAKSNKLLEQWLRKLIELPEDFSLSDTSTNYFKDG